VRLVVIDEPVSALDQSSEFCGELAFDRKKDHRNIARRADQGLPSTVRSFVRGDAMRHVMRHK